FSRPSGPPLGGHYRQSENALSGARRGRVGDVPARGRGGRERLKGCTRIESAYGYRCRRQHADAARQPEKGAVARCERVTHLACTIRLGFVLLMHRARLTIPDWTVT